MTINNIGLGDLKCHSGIICMLQRCSLALKEQSRRMVLHLSSWLSGFIPVYADFFVSINFTDNLSGFTLEGKFIICFSPTHWRRFPNTLACFGCSVAIPAANNTSFGCSSNTLTPEGIEVILYDGHCRC